MHHPAADDPLLFLQLTHRPPRTPLFPYTTLFRSLVTMTETGTNTGIFTACLNTSIASGAGANKDRKSTRLNSSHVKISYAVFCLKKKRLTRGEWTGQRRYATQAARGRSWHEVRPR